MMLSRLRAYLRGVTEVGREVRGLREDMDTIRREWDDELAEMRGMWDKLQLWAARQAKRDKAITQTSVEALVNDGADPKASALFPAQMTKAELRVYAANLKAGGNR